MTKKFKVVVAGAGPGDKGGIKGSSLRLTLVADCQLYSTVNKPNLVLFVSGSYKCHLTPKSSCSTTCTFQPVIIEMARSV